MLTNPDFSTENPDTDHIGAYAALAKVKESQRTIAGLTCLLSGAMLLYYFTFSKKLSLLTDVLASAKLDIVFFMLMFFWILMGYTLVGYLLLGHNYLDFDLINDALIACYNMLYGEYNYREILRADSFMGGIYFITFMILFNLVLLNMFIAIITSHFN